MTETTGDIWGLEWDVQARQHGAAIYRVIPTNGSVNSRGLAVMGRGVALQAAERFPGLREGLGKLLLSQGNKVHYNDAYGLITFPVKHNWYSKAKTQLVRRSCKQLFELPWEGSFILMPRVGCGNGGLDWEEQVKPILEEELGEINGLIVVSLPDGSSGVD